MVTTFYWPNAEGNQTEEGLPIFASTQKAIAKAYELSQLKDSVEALLKSLSNEILMIFINSSADTRARITEDRLISQPITKNGKRRMDEISL